MSNLSIRVNGVTLDYERSDLKIKKENIALRSSFKVAHTSYPLRVVNNKNTQDALGDLSIKSTSKKISYDCEVLIGASVYNGKLTIKKPTTTGKFIEVDITFGSVLVDLANKKLSEFLPNVNVNGDDPSLVPFEDESDSEHNAQVNFVSQAASYINLNFPQVYYQYPEMRYLDRYDDMAEDEDHRFFRKKINARDTSTGDLLQNYTEFVVDEIIPYNLNCVAPQVYAMAPIVRAFESLGYGVAGTFVDHAIFNLLLFTSFNDQMTEVKALPPSESYYLNPTTFSGTFSGFNGYDFIYFGYVKQSIINFPTVAGRYKVVLFFDCLEFTPGHLYGLFVDSGNNENIGNVLTSDPEILKQEYSFEVTEDNTDSLRVFFVSTINEFATDYSIKIVPDVPDVILYDVHPTIDFSRYVPDWNIVEAVNNFKNLLNLEVYIDDIEQVVYMNFNEDKLLTENWYDLKGRFRESGITAINQEYFSLKMANDDDDILLISNDGAVVSTENPAHTTEISNKFKVIPVQNGTAFLSEDLKDRSGQGIMLYNLIAPPYIASSFAGVKMELSGTNGIYENFWKVWLQYRLNASPLTLSGPLTNTQIVLIEKFQRFYMNSQRYMVDTIVVRDSGGLFLDVELQVETVNF